MATRTHLTGGGFQTVPHRYWLRPHI